jgi:hypothetical protein
LVMKQTNGIQGRTDGSSRFVFQTIVLKEAQRLPMHCKVCLTTAKHLLLLRMLLRRPLHGLTLLGPSKASIALLPRRRLVLHLRRPCVRAKGNVQHIPCWCRLHMCRSTAKRGGTQSKPMRMVMKNQEDSQ